MADELQLLAETDFPPLLREIPDMPKRLYLRGELPSFEHAWLAVVGSRACTDYGKRTLRYLIEGLRGYPVVIVSGLALGIDAEAHRAAIDVGLPTVGIPGSGLDWNVLYPRTHVQLAEEILATGGALLSEEEPGTRAAVHTFPKRNRIMAGLSRATLLIEAKERSGTLITARLATEYNRDLLVVPGSIFSDTSRGTHQFLKLGATPITSPEELIDALDISARTDATAASRRRALSPDEERVLAHLATPCSRDELLRALDMPVSDANVLLSAMEIKGCIVEEFGVVRIA